MGLYGVSWAINYLNAKLVCMRAPKNFPKYTLLLTPKDEYKKPYRKDIFSKHHNNLELLLYFVYKHTRSHVRNPWQYIHILNNNKGDSIFFFPINK